MLSLRCVARRMAEIPRPAPRILHRTIKAVDLLDVLLVLPKIYIVLIVTVVELVTIRCWIALLVKRLLLEIV